MGKAWQTFIYFLYIFIYLFTPTNRRFTAAGELRHVTLKSFSRSIPDRCSVFAPPPATVRRPLPLRKNISVSPPPRPRSKKKLFLRLPLSVSPEAAPLPHATRASAASAPSSLPLSLPLPAHLGGGRPSARRRPPSSSSSSSPLPPRAARAGRRRHLPGCCAGAAGHRGALRRPSRQPSWATHRPRWLAPVASAMPT